MNEIERKFLLNSEDFKAQAQRSFFIKQGYLNSDPERTVRIRIKGDSGFITIKGKSNKSGTTRYEWEKSISLKEAEDLLLLCEPGVIEKERFEVPLDDHIIEVDVFQGMNEGLILAEIELSEEKEQYPNPNWLGKEVTGDPKYYNSYLSQMPFTSWS